MDIAARQQEEKRHTFAVGCAWIAVLLTCIFAYHPGLKGPFLLDDISTIQTLGNLGGVTDWNTFKAFVFGGHAGPTGRPLALLSFLIDGNNWPTDSWPFKRTNLVIHLINGALLGVLINTILRLLDFDRQKTHWIALISAACWMLHPFLVSTTLYAVQRMAQLSALFTFAGLIAYLHFRVSIASNATKAYIGMSLSAVVFMFLATISKENGALLPVLIGVLEITVIVSAGARLPNLNRYWNIAFIVLPSVAIALYLGEKLFTDSFFEVLPPRDFSLYERLLTQPRVLVDYLQHWYIPQLYTTGVFQDHFIKSTGLLSPITSALSLLLHVAIISIALAMRRQWPLFALAALFYYASHVLESSVLNLELYFEHRNYLAAAFLFLPLIELLHRHVSRQLFFAVTTVAVLVLGGFTRYSATVWQDYSSIVEASARKAPTSARAQAEYSVILFNEQRYDDALRVIERAIENVPNDRPLLLVNRIIMLCNRGLLTASDFEQVAGIVSKLRYDTRSIKLYTELSLAVADERCPNVSLGDLKSMFGNMSQLPSNNDRKSLGYAHIKYFVGLLEMYSGEPAKAVTTFEESLQSKPVAEHAMTMAEHLASREYYEEALYLSELALLHLHEDLRDVSQRSLVNESDIDEFRAVVRARIDARRDAEQARSSPES